MGLYGWGLFGIDVAAIGVMMWDIQRTVKAKILGKAEVAQQKKALDGITANVRNQRMQNEMTNRNIKLFMIVGIVIAVLFIIFKK